MTTIECDDHERVEWEGHIVCANCERVYQTKDDELPRFAPMICACGQKLMPDRDPEQRKSIDFSARPCCPKCYQERSESLLRELH